MFPTTLIIGLGNVGKQYANTRHNIGFMAVDALARYYHFPVFHAKYKGEISEGIIEERKIILLKPHTLMNRSGIAASEVVRFYKIPLSHVIVLYDELDIPVGKVKVKTGGGSGGHNGIKSLDAHIGQDYRRIRIGIDHPQDRDKVTSYVLGAFLPEEHIKINVILDALAKAIPTILSGSNADFTTKLALLTRS